MPFQNLGKFRQQREGNELHYALSMLEEDLDLEREFVAITRYQKPYTKKILTTTQRSNKYISRIY